MHNIDSVLQQIEDLDQTTETKELLAGGGKMDFEQKPTVLWSVPRTTGQLLEQLVLKYKPKHILEIGASGGYSTLWLARAATTYDGAITTIEMLPWKATLAREHFELADVADSIELVEGTALDVLEDWDQRVDFIFLDADRKNYVRYIEQLDQWLPAGAIVIADNALDCEDFKSYQEYMAKRADFDSALINLDNGLLLSIKK